MRWQHRSNFQFNLDRLTITNGVTEYMEHTQYTNANDTKKHKHSFNSNNNKITYFFCHMK